MLFQSLVAYVALTLLTTVYASPVPVPAEPLNNRGIEISREVEVTRNVAGRRSDWRRDGLDNAVLELKRAGTDDGHDWRRAEENAAPAPPWKRVAEAEAGPPGGPPGW